MVLRSRETRLRGTSWPLRDFGAPSRATPGKRRAVWRGDQHEIETHALAQFTKLILNRAACIGALGVRKQELHPGFQRAVFPSDLQKPAVLQIALRMNIGDGNLALAQRGMQSIANRRLHKSLDHPEAACEQHSKRQKAQQQSACS